MHWTKWTGLARRLPSSLYKIGVQTYIDYSFPRHIFIETTGRCNLSCSFCPRDETGQDMDFKLFRKIIDECSLYGPRSFSLHLFGEPLMYPYILDAIRYIKAKNKHHTILLTTNGTLLNKFAKDLLELRVDRIIWSWRRNNFNDETLRVLRKIGMVRLLIEETPKEEFEKWLKFPRVEVKHLHNYGGNIDLSKWGMVGGDKPSRYPCYHLWLAPSIRFNGEITFCCNVPKIGDEVLGIYGKETLADVWAGDKIRSIREMHMKAQYTGACVGCNSWQAYPDIWFESQKNVEASKQE